VRAVEREDADGIAADAEVGRDIRGTRNAQE
jgi:hypothetical protein